MITQKVFSRLDEKDVYAYTLEDGGLRVTVTDYGASIQSVVFRGRELVLGHDGLEDYVQRRNFFGATIGRIANRVAGGTFTLNGRRYTLDKNDGDNSLHGGGNGFDRRLFESRVDGDCVIFTLESRSGDQGCGGNLKLEVKYYLADGALNTEYTARSDEDTVWCPTNHAYFNFSGGNASVCDTRLKINADKFTPVDGKLIPTGELRSVVGTPFDFTQLKPIGKDIGADDEQLRAVGGGYDHNFVLNGGCAAVAEYGGVRLELYTDMPGLQFYSGNFLDGERCRGGAYGKHSAFCLEPQYFPNAVNEESFETPLLKAGEVKKHFIKYKFI